MPKSIHINSLKFFDPRTSDKIPRRVRRKTTTGEPKNPSRDVSCYPMQSRVES